ncbi:MAG: serine/threonine protein kinase [Gammaproteobacteria bacterium]|nr:serine/threonine protein kinase [Gammaproteobacteria bacterium]
MAELEDTPYADLSPDVILDALESAGFAPTGGLLELNSYENRVFQLELEDGGFVVTKFYRPGRWSDEQIAEEHEFSIELADAEVPVVTPLERDGVTLFQHAGYRFAVYPRQGGHPPNIEDPGNLRVLARTIARIHAVGATRRFASRPDLTVARLGEDSRTFLLEHQFLPPDVEPAYASITEHLLSRLGETMDRVRSSTEGRIHGDCHLGNLLWRYDTPHFVDFDDCVNGPAIQDLWMLLSGEREERQVQLKTIIDAYETFHHFNPATLALVEPLRTLRIMHHAAWIARRWHDPAFPRAFPTFDSSRYWSEHVLTLREQMAALDEPALAI